MQQYLDGRQNRMGDILMTRVWVFGLLIFISALAGCQSLADAIALPTAIRAAETVDNYCDERRNYPDSRERWVILVNQHTVRSYMTPMDCDMDGELDFQIPIPE